MRIPQLPGATGKNYQMEDVDQNDTLDQDDPKIWCLRGNAAALVPEYAQWHLQQSSHGCHFSLLSLFLQVDGHLLKDNEDLQLPSWCSVEGDLH